MSAVQPSDVRAAEAEAREHVRALRQAQARLRALIAIRHGVTSVE